MILIEEEFTMSKESVKKFITDAQEKTELKDIFEKTKSGFDSKEAKRDYIAKEAKKYGYSFTADELKALLAEQSNSLSDDDLGNVAGGSWVGKGIKFVGNILGELL